MQPYSSLICTFMLPRKQEHDGGAILLDIESARSLEDDEDEMLAYTCFVE